MRLYRRYEGKEKEGGTHETKEGAECDEVCVYKTG